MDPAHDKLEEKTSKIPVPIAMPASVPIGFSGKDKTEALSGKKIWYSFVIKEKY